MELDDILSGKKEQTNEEPVIVKDPVEKEVAEGEAVQNRRREWREKELNERAAGEGKERDPVTGKFVPKEEKKEEVQVKEEPKPEVKEPPKQDLTEREKAFLAAAHEERRKRQELEQRFQQQQQPQQQEQPKTFWEDPDNALAAYRQEIEKTKQELAGAVFKTRIDTADELARMRYQDYDEVIEVFKQVASQAPGLVQQCFSSPNPAEFAYRLGKHHKELREVGSIEEYKKKAEKELRMKIEAELKEKYEKEAKERAALVPSLSDARSTQSNKPVWGGPTPLDNILGS